MKSVLVVGDAMIDDYIEVEVSRVSPEAPVLVGKKIRDWFTPGGAANVALQIASLGTKATLMTGAEAIWISSITSSLYPELSDILHVKCDNDWTFPIPSKTRFVSACGQQLFRLDVEEEPDPETSVIFRPRFESLVIESLHEFSLVIISDYNKGTVTESLAKRIIRECSERDIRVIVDSKKSNYSCFEGAFLITPNLKEAMAAMSSFSANPKKDHIALSLSLFYLIDNVLVTNGREGMTLASPEIPFATREFKATNPNAVDPTGAGDTVLGVMAYLLAEGNHSVVECCEIANRAAGIAVGHRGCYTVKPEDLHPKDNRKNINPKYQLQAFRCIHKAKEEGKKIVFVNGCFDILHAGHVHLLQEAKKLGDFLVVAVNSDESVDRLKGTGHPIVQEEHRKKVLAGLASVDLVMNLNEDDPSRLIEQIAPDVIVKGNDYANRKIVEMSAIEKAGSKLVFVNRIDGLSSSKISRGIRDGTSDSPEGQPEHPEEGPEETGVSGGRSWWTEPEQDFERSQVDAHPNRDQCDKPF